ncbi:ABC transporter permease [Rhizobium cauense]|uniref:ABC transporter permease n=1 Tax=Rhizobium cauense TaxID=1166683 RepID=UPI001C6E65A6|nr:ABC transporter permease [Rhizobium cauense]MBW9116310.1 ABC transporter permease [Rhizobium cauense]
MLTTLFDQQVLVGLGQAAAAICLCLGVVALCRHFQVQVERETVISLVRGLIQMSVVGLVLGFLLKGSLLIGAIILLGMVTAAAFTVSQRFPGLPYVFEISLYSVGAGGFTAIVFMLLTKSLSTNITVLVPVGSMIIANSMNASAQAMERFRSDVFSHVGQVEAALCLGAKPEVSVSPYVQSAVYASLLPRLDMLKSLGLVWIPGVMAGMLVTGASPLYAGIYQFVIVAMILIASGVSGMGATALMQRHAFSEAGQLLLRPTLGEAVAPAGFLARVFRRGAR